MPRYMDYPLVWVLICGWSSWSLATFIPIWRFDLRVLGIWVAGVGLAVIIWSAWWFWRKRTPIEPRNTPKALIVEGPYRINRNPIYTGMVIILIGQALWLGALSAFITVLAFPLSITHRFILAEEEALRAAFGKGAETYLTSTRRW